MTKKAWTVEVINKKTSKPSYKIDNAQEYSAVQKEIEIAGNMLNILAGFASKIEKIEEVFFLFVLPLVSRLEDLKLRLILAEI